MAFVYYHYDPSMVAAIIFVLLFGLSTALHLYQLLGTRTWIMTPLIIGGIFECTGYIGRTISSQQTPNWTLVPFLIQSLFLLVAPALLATTIYMQLGRIIQLVNGEAHALIKRRWLTKIFVCGDILSFSVQAAGGGLQAGGTESALKNGANIVVGGLCVQILFFGLFILVAVAFDIAMHRAPTAEARRISQWRKHLIALYISSGLILIRSIFRVVEFVEGFDGYILQHEFYLYTFDSVLMLAVLVAFNTVHPSEVKALMRGGKASRVGFRLVSVEKPKDHVVSDVESV